MNIELEKRLYPIRYEWGRVLVLFALAGVVFVLGWFFPMGMVYDYLGWGHDALRSILLGLLVRGGIVLIYPAVLWFGGFFDKAEKESLRRLIGDGKRKLTGMFRSG